MIERGLLNLSYTISISVPNWNPDVLGFWVEEVRLESMVKVVLGSKVYSQRWTYQVV